MQAKVPKEVLDAYQDKEMVFGKVPFNGERMFSALLAGAEKVEVTQIQPGDIISKDGKQFKVRRIDGDGNPVYEKGRRVRRQGV